MVVSVRRGIGFFTAGDDRFDAVRWISIFDGGRFQP
jgi:hypothetical protein